MVVHGLEGFDEISTIGQTKITSLKRGKISTSYMRPEDFGLRTVERRVLEGSTPEESASITFRILNDHVNPSEDDPKRDIVLVNTAAAIQVVGKAETIKEGMEIAKESIRSGAAYEKLKSLIKFSDGDMSKLEELERHG